MGRKGIGQTEDGTKGDRTNRGWDEQGWDEQGWDEDMMGQTGEETKRKNLRG